MNADLRLQILAGDTASSSHHQAKIETGKSPGVFPWLSGKVAGDYLFSEDAACLEGLVLCRTLTSNSPPGKGLKFGLLGLGKSHTFIPGLKSDVHSA